MTPWQIAKDSEHSHQAALFAWCNCASNFGVPAANNELTYNIATRATALGHDVFTPVPALAFIFAIPNGGLRDKITAGKLKAEGVKPGVPDVFLPVPRLFRNGIIAHGNAWQHGLFLEIKKPSQKPKRAGVGGVSAEQSKYHAFLVGRGYEVTVCYSWLEARDEIVAYLT